MKQYSAFHIFSGSGGGALGFRDSRSRVATYDAVFNTMGGIDFDPEACTDFEELVGAPCLHADVHDLQPARLRKMFGDECPDVVLSSPPCKSFSRLLPKKRTTLEKYVVMSRLMLTGTHLVLSTWKTVPRILFFENVPGISSRGHDVLVALRGLLAAHGYATAEGVHDCGVVGGLAQHRRRWFLIARHRESVGRVVYQPPVRPVIPVGNPLGALPLPFDVSGEGGPMHVLPGISALTWARLASIPPGGDWRDLPGGGDHRGRAGSGDVRLSPGIGPNGYTGNYRVLMWNQTARTVTGAGRPASGAPSVADPRMSLGQERFSDDHRVVRWDDAARTVTGATRPGSGAQSVADPRLRLTCIARNGSMSGPHRGTYGVLDWNGPSGTVTGGAAPTRGRFSVGDPRVMAESDFKEQIEVLLSGESKKRPAKVPVIVGPWGTWNRPLTTLELAVIQGFPSKIDGEWLRLTGRATTRWRQRIGNAIPPPAARRVGDQMLRALLGADADIADELALDPVWVTPSLYGAVVA